MKIEELIEKIHSDIKLGYPNIAINRLLDSWEATVSPLLDKYYQEQKKIEIFAISQRFNSMNHIEGQENFDAIRVEANRIVDSILSHLVELKKLAIEVPKPNESEDDFDKKDYPNKSTKNLSESLNSKELLLQSKSDNEYKQFLREWGKSLTPKEKIDKLNNIVNHSNKPRSVLNEAVDIRIEFELLPILKKRIEIESNLRKNHKIPYSQERIEQIKAEFIETIKNDWSSIVYMGFTDAVRNAEIFIGAPEYKIKELEKDRDALLLKFPNVLLEIVLEMLNNDYLDMMLNQ